MKLFTAASVIWFALPLAGTPLIEVFAESHFVLPDVHSLCPNVGDSYEVSHFVEFDQRYIITINGDEGDAWLGIDVDLHATALNFRGPDILSSHARLQSPFELATRAPDGNWSGTGPLQCQSIIDLRCRIPVRFDEPFELRISGVIEDRYAYFKQHADQRPQQPPVLWQFARVTLFGTDRVLRQTDTGEFRPVDGAQISVVPMVAHSPEPATVVMLVLALGTGWWWKRRQ